jgi:hypothetical protein
MNQNLSNIENYEKLLPVAGLLYEHTSKLSWEMLLPLFLLSIAFGYTSDLGISGAILTRLKRLILVSLLLVAFPKIANFCQILGVEVAKSIDDMTGIDHLLDAAAASALGTTKNLVSLVSNFGGSVVLNFLMHGTYLILVFARMFLLAFQHFYWFLMVAIAPFLILGMLFEASTAITRGLFKNMLQVASWPVIWSVLSAFIKAMPFSTVYSIENNDVVSICVMNLIFAVALLFSPFIVSQICDGVSLSLGTTLKSGVLTAVSMAAGPKGVAMRTAAVSALRKGGGASSKFSRSKP